MDLETILPYIDQQRENYYEYYLSLGPRYRGHFKYSIEVNLKEELDLLKFYESLKKNNIYHKVSPNEKEIYLFQATQTRGDRRYGIYSGIITSKKIILHRLRSSQDLEEALEKMKSYLKLCSDIECIEDNSLFSYKSYETIPDV